MMAVLSPAHFALETLLSLVALYGASVVVKGLIVLVGALLRHCCRVGTPGDGTHSSNLHT